MGDAGGFATEMVIVFNKLSDVIKRSLLDEPLRYNSLYYRPVQNLLKQLDGMGREARQELTDRLTRRALGWAAELPGSPAASVPLEQWPLIEKSEIQSQPGRFTRPGLIRLTAETSGSTGIPVKLYRSLQNIAAEQAFADELLGVWNLTFAKARMAILRADFVKPLADEKPPYGKYYKGGRKLVLSSNHLSPATAQWFYEELGRFRPEVFFTHPSSGEALAYFMQQAGVTLNIPVILTSSEMLHPSGRSLLESTFHASVVDHYGMAERVVSANGLATKAYFFNPAYGRVELFSTSSGEALPGFNAYEIVATSYWNDAMPLVRYKTSDRAIVPDTYSGTDLEDVCLGLKPVIAIQGRDKEHLISPSGQIIVGLTHASSGVEGLVRMQLVQDSLDAVTVKVVVDPRVGAIDTKQLLRNIYMWAPRSMRFDIQPVNEILRLPSGKTPFVIRRLQ